MASPTPRHFVAPAVRRTVSTLLSFCIIFSLLLQPVAAIAVTYSPAVALAGNASAPTNRSTNTPDHALKENPTEAAASRPATSPKMRTLAHVTPTASGAKPAYPLNHMLDGRIENFGPPPTNHNFEAPGSLDGAPPANHDFSIGPFEIGTPPANHDFTNGLTDWITTGSASIQNDVIHGNYAYIPSGGSLTSAPFFVDNNAQQAVFELGYLSTTNGNQVQILALTGAPNYTTATTLVVSKCNSCGSWVTYGVNLAGYQGQSIKLKFVRGNGQIGIDRLRTGILLPPYTVSGLVDRITDVAPINS